MRTLAASDPSVAALIHKEQVRQRSTLPLLASENYVSTAVLEAIGSVMTNKFSEGYPGRRYGAGCEYVDELETLGIERAKNVFGADHANLQPHSGSQANMAAYLAVAELGDTILAMRQDCGGHLTHGAKVNFSSRLFRFVGYGVGREDELIDHDRVHALALEHRPRVIVAGASSYPRAIDFARFRDIADEVDAVLIVDASHYIGLVAGGAYPNPVPYADIVTSTTYKVLRGPRGGMILSSGRHAAAIDRAVFPLVQSGPHANLTAAKTVALGEASTPGYARYATRVVENARALADELVRSGFRVAFGGTDSHMVIVDVLATGLTGREAESRLAQCGIVANRNLLPYDVEGPAVTSGLRLGSAAVTTLGADDADMRRMGRLIHAALLEDPSPRRTDDLRGRSADLVNALHSTAEHVPSRDRTLFTAN